MAWKRALVVDDEKIKRAWQRHYDKDKNQDDEK